MRATLISALIVLATAVPSAAQQGPQEAKPLSKNPYAPIEWLIGDWVSDENGNRIRQSFRWGPKNSYILYSTYTTMNRQAEALHFEGILVWNGKSNGYDYVFAIEPGSGGQEKGTMSIQTDGSIVRDVELTAPDGKVGRFQQTFRSTGQGTAITSLMRQTANGWQPNFPGSDRIAMTRQSGH